MVSQDVIIYLDRLKNTKINDIKKVSKLLDTYEMELSKINELIDNEIQRLSDIQVKSDQVKFTIEKYLKELESG
jgi:precorrin-4 methylase